MAVMPPWIVVNVVGFDEGAVDGDMTVVTAYESPAAKPAPQIPPECHNTRPVNPNEAMAAVRAMCEGNAR